MTHAGWSLEQTSLSYLDNVMYFGMLCVSTILGCTELSLGRVLSAQGCSKPVVTSKKKRCSNPVLLDGPGQTTVLNTNKAHLHAVLDSVFSGNGRIMTSFVVLIQWVR